MGNLKVIHFLISIDIDNVRINPCFMNGIKLVRGCSSDGNKTIFIGGYICECGSERALFLNVASELLLNFNVRIFTG